MQEKQKRININKFGRLPLGVGRWGRVVHVFCFGSFVMGEKTHKQHPQKTPGKSREMFGYVFFPRVGFGFFF